MDRRKFLVGSAAVSAATVAAAATAANATALPRAKSSELNETADGTGSQWRLQYPLTQAEKADGTFVHDQTFPTNDPRRYEPPREIDQQAVMDEYYKAF